MTQYVTSITTTGAGLTWAPSETERPKQTPKGLLVTRAVETADGWLGHLIIDGAIVYETKPHLDSDEALADVNGRVVARLKKVFG